MIPVASVAFSQTRLHRALLDLRRQSDLPHQHRVHVSPDLPGLPGCGPGAGRRLRSGQCGDRAISGSDRNGFQRLLVRRDRRICDERADLPELSAARRCRSGLIRIPSSARRPRIRAASSCSAATNGKSSSFTSVTFTRCPVNPSNTSFPNGVSSIAPGIIVPPGFVTTNAYTVPRILNTVWTGAALFAEVQS